jgi:predicted nucleic acid-binding protein
MMGRGARFMWIQAGDDEPVPDGFFWSEVLTGPHLSVDYHWGEQALTVQGHRADPCRLDRFSRWTRVDQDVPLPEILHGLARLPVGRRRQALEARWEQLVADLFAGRVFSFDRPAAHWYAALLQQRERLGQPISTTDALIAAIALALGATLATRNTVDFDGIGLALINPWPAP